MIGNKDFNLDKDISKMMDYLSSNMKNLTGEALDSAVVETHKSIMRTSPVRKGFYRSNNFVSIDKTHDTEETSNRKMAQRKREAEGLKFEIGKNKVYYIFNNSPYSEKLEKGHSKQAPSGVYIPASFRVIRYFARFFKQKKFDFGKA